MRTIEEKFKITREEIQQKAIDFSENNHFMVLNYPTGLGKSYTVIQILDNIYKKNNTCRCLLLEPEISLKGTIKDEFIKFKKDYLLKGIDIICYASLKNIDKEYDIIVLDEAHHCFSNLRINILKNQNPKYVFLLSATLNDSQIKICEKIFKCNFLCHKISLHNAIKFGILPSPKIGLFKLKLNNNIINCQYSFKRGNSKKRINVEVNKEKDKWNYIKDKFNYPNLNLIVNCTEQQKYNQLRWEADLANKNYVDENEKLINLKKLIIDNREIRKQENKVKNKKTLWLYSELCIKRFLSNIKTPFIKSFLKDALFDNRLIAFVGSIAQAKELFKCINELNIISSEEKNKDNQKKIDDFNNKKINNLIAIGKLQEGVNLKDIKTVIISQLDGGSRAIIQKVGRGLRSKFPEIFIFCYEDTKDEDYLFKALDNFEMNMVTELDYFYKE